MKFLILTGISGAGKTQAANFLEDIGYYCVDNLPPSLIPKFVEICIGSIEKFDNIVLVMDVRGGELLNELFPSLETINDAGFEYKILFLDASDNVLVKRFKENRRAHPLAPGGRIIDGLKEERNILKDIRNKADFIIDTSNLLPRQLKEEITNILNDTKNEYENIITSIVSFGFKHSIPTDSDLIFDVRFIPNPFYIPKLKGLTGKHKKVSEYVFSFEETNVFSEKLLDMISFLIPYYAKEGKSQLVVSIGCTGGKHRSVTIAEFLYKKLLENGNRAVLQHRDIDVKGK